MTINSEKARQRLNKAGYLSITKRDICLKCDEIDKVLMEKGGTKVLHCRTHTAQVKPYGWCPSFSIKLSTHG